MCAACYTKPTTLAKTTRAILNCKEKVVVMVTATAAHLLEGAPATTAQMMAPARVQQGQRPPCHLAGRPPHAPRVDAPDACSAIIKLFVPGGFAHGPHARSACATLTCGTLCECLPACTSCTLVLTHAQAPLTPKLLARCACTPAYEQLTHSV